MPSYSVSLNAVVAPAGGAIARLQAVCAVNSVDNTVVVATAANLAAASGFFRGVAIESAAGGQGIQIVDYGTVDLLGATLSGSGQYVNVDASGNLARSSSSSSATVGVVENGSIHVNVSLGLGVFSGNATQLQGVPISSSVATESWVMAGKGSSVRMRPDSCIDFQDYLDKNNVSGNGTDNCLPALQEFLNALQNYGRPGWVPNPAVAYNIDIDASGYRPYIIDDTAHGNKRGITVRGAHQMSGYSQTLMFRFTCTEPTGTAGTISGYGNTGTVNPIALSSAGVTQKVTAFTLGAGGAAVTVATKERWIGSWIRVVMSAGGTPANFGEFIIVDVPSDGVVVYENRNVGAAGTDATNGAIPWKIQQVGMDIRARDVTLDGLSFSNKIGQSLMAQLEINTPAGAGNVSVSNVHIHHCSFFTQQETGSPMRFGITIARRIAPRVGHSNYSTNAAGVLTAWDPSQTDTINLSHNLYYFAQEFGIEHVSASGQSKECKSLTDRFVFCRGGYGMPTRNISEGGAGHMDITNPSFNVRDVCIVVGASSSSERVITNGYVEGDVRILIDRGGGAASPIRFTGGKWLASGGPSGEVIYSNSSTLQFHGSIGPFDGTAANPKKSHIVLDGGTSGGGGDPGHEMHAYFRGYIQGKTDWTGRRPKCSTQRGPWKLNPTDTIDYRLYGGADAGTRRSVACTANAFLYATGVTVDLNWVRPWHVGALLMGGPWSGTRAYVVGCVVRPGNGFRYICTVAGTSGVGVPTWPIIVGNTVPDGGVTWMCIEDLSAWGGPDDRECVIQSNVPSDSGGQIQVVTNGQAFGSADVTAMGWNADLRLGGVRTQISKDTNGWLDHSSVGLAGSEPLGVCLDWFMQPEIANTSVQLVQSRIANKRYGSRLKGGTDLSSITGMSGMRTAVPARNFWADVTHTGGTGATFTWDTVTPAPDAFVTEDNSTYPDVMGIVIGQTGAPAAGSTTLISQVKATTGVTFTTVDPGPGNSVKWRLFFLR